MQKFISALEARQNLGELLDQVHHHNKHIIIKRAKKPMAALISMQTYQQFLKQRERDFSVLDSVWAKLPSFPVKEIERDIQKAINQVRARKKTI